MDKLPFRLGGFAGPFGTGKTLACLDLIVMLRQGGVPKDQLLVIDTHGSVEPYTMIEPYRDQFDYVLTLENPDVRDVSGSIIPAQIAWFNKWVESKEQRFLTVIDTIEPLQDAFVQQVWDDPSLTPAYKEKMKGLMWGRTKKELLKILLKMLKRSQSLLVTIHTRKEWVAGQPTSRIESKFLEPVYILSQFIGIMTRRPNIQLPDVCFVPGTRNMGKVQFPALPPTIPEFSWTKMFNYIGKAPADWSKLKKEEMASEGLELLDKIAAITKAGESTPIDEVPE